MSARKKGKPFTKRVVAECITMERTFGGYTLTRRAPGCAPGNDWRIDLATDRKTARIVVNALRAHALATWRWPCQ